MTGTNKYERDFMLPAANKRGGRIDARLFQNVDDVGDGNPGMQKIQRNLMAAFLGRYILEGCTYTGTTLAAGWIMWNTTSIEVLQQTIVVANSEWLYLDISGVAHVTAVEATALANIMISYRNGAGTLFDAAPRISNNEMEIYRVIINNNLTVSNDATVGNDLTVTNDLTVGNDLDVDGIANLDNTDIDGTLDVSGVTDLHSALDMNNNDIQKVKDLDVDGSIDCEGDIDVNGTSNLDNTDIDGTLDVSGVTDLHDTVDMNNNDIEKIKDLDVDGNCDIEGDVDINGTTNLDNTDIDGTLDVSGTVDVHSDIDLNDTDLKNVKAIDGNGDAVIFNDDIQMVSSNIDMNTNNMNNLNILNSTYYYCNTEAEINAAVAAIGAGGGTIILLAGTITLSAAIDLDGGGTYKIFGQGRETIIDVGGNWSGFDISSVTSCVLKDFSIDINDYSGGYKGIEVTQDNVLVDNVHVYGDSTNGNGIHISGCNNITVRDSSFINSDVGIYIATTNYVTVRNCYISNCVTYNINAASGAYTKITECNSIGADQHNISSTSSTFLTISNNNISGCGNGYKGIYIQGGSKVSIDNNHIHDMAGEAIYTKIDYATVSNNIIYNINGTSYVCGIHIDNAGTTKNRVAVSNNIIYNITSSNAGAYANGIYVEAVHYMAITGNIIYTVTSATNNFKCAGINIAISFSSTITGNHITDVNVTGSETGYGILIDTGSIDVVVTGNIAQWCDTNWTDSGTDTTNTGNRFTN